VAHLWTLGSVRHPLSRLAVVSLVSSALPTLLAAWAFSIYWFGGDTRGHREDVLSLGVVSLWLTPLVFAGIVTGLFAHGARRLCCIVGILPLLSWASILLTEGGL
jgi:hypothetical protein